MVLIILFDRYVSRVSPKDSLNHIIMAIHDYKTREFATQLNLNVKNAWGVLKYFAEQLTKLEDGKYILLRDSEKVILSYIIRLCIFTIYIQSSVKIYQIPLDAFEDSKTEEYEDDYSAKDDIVVVEDKD
jgi:translation initiation factor 3 subunit D